MRIGNGAVKLGVVASVLCFLLAGCSQQTAAAASLATTSSNAAAAAQTASFALRLQHRGRLVPGVSSTALGDVLTDLQKADSTLTGSQEPKAVKKLATQTLMLVRQAEDVVGQAEDTLSQNQSPSLASLEDRLTHISRLLSKIEKSARAAS